MRCLLVLMLAAMAVSAQAADALDSQFREVSRERQPAVCQGAYTAYEQWVIDRVEQSNILDRQWQQHAYETALDTTMNMLVMQALVKAGPEAALGPGVASRWGSVARTRLDTDAAGVREVAELLDARCKPLMLAVVQDGTLKDDVLQSLFEQAQSQTDTRYSNAFERARGAQEGYRPRA